MYRKSQLTALFSGRTILIAGYGREGKSTHALLNQLLPQQPVDVATNDAEIFSALEQKSYDMIIKSPGISTLKFEGRCSLDIITSQTDLFLQVFGDQTIAVTGTKGKSTTTSLLYHMLRCQDDAHRKPVLAGNIGIPLFDIIPQLDEASLVVAELSCHQLENIHRGPHIGILLNLFQEHLDHYRDYLGYKMAKLQMALRQTPDDVCFYCRDCEELAQLIDQLLPQCGGQLVPYSAQQVPSHFAQHTSLQGAHNLSNIFVASLVAAQLGISENHFLSAVESFKGLPHRLEHVGTFKGIDFYNDSISTIPEAAIAAVEALQRVDTLILGGFDRGIDYSPLVSYLSDAATLGFHVRNLVFVGEAGRRMHQLLSQANALQNRQVLIEDSYPRLVSWCFEHTMAGRICLLSPAAASYDAFKNFEERGTIYKELIINRQ